MRTSFLGYMQYNEIEMISTAYVHWDIYHYNPVSQRFPPSGEQPEQRILAHKL